jgi:hypothetical protein
MHDTMPQNAPGSLTAPEYIDVLAHVLSLNKYPAGDVDLGKGDEAATLADLKLINFPAD